MANITLTTKIIQRNDTKANWESVNPILSKGEIGIEVDTKHFKIGDGVNTWGQLEYANVLPADIADLGVGDMKKSVYDKDGDGKVDVANTADTATKLKTAVTIAGVSFDGSSNITLTKANIGLGNVDNTSDKNKPISTATQNAIDAIKGGASVGVTLGTVDAKADANTAEISTLKGRVATTEGKITALEELNVTQEGKITAVENKAQANATSIGEIDARVTTNEGAITTLKDTVSGHGTRLTAVESKATTNASDISSIKTRTSNLETKVDVTKVSTAISTAISASEAKLGTSATKNIGTSAGQVVTVQSNGKISPDIIPSIAITDVFTASSESGMLALSSAEKGDICIRTDKNETYILIQNGYSVLSNWKKLETPTDAVSSVNGMKGAVTLTTSNITEGSNLYYTEARVNTNFKTHKSTELTDSSTLLRTTDVVTLNGGGA